MTTPPTGTVTFLFTDIEGSTEFAQHYPDDLPRLLARHHSIMREAINAHHGFVFKVIGDAFCAAFPTADDALNASVAAQRVLQHEAWSPAPVKVRMGLNSGNSQPEFDGERVIDYTGYLTLTLAQRVMSTAYGNQVLIANATAELLRGHLPKAITLRDMGEHRLKGLTNLERVWQVVAPDLISEFPALHTLNAVPNNLPTQLTSFIGREKEIQEVKKSLESSRMVTLTGVGGTGKTRLSYQVATELLEKFADGARLVELAPLTDAGLIPQTLANVFGVRAEGQSMMSVVIDYLRDKQLLLILDNCEHLITACAKLSDELLKNCSQLTILASSREALGIAGELAYHVPSLTLPSHKSSIDELQHCEAARLFIERATVMNPHLAITEQNAKSIAMICQRLDGIPLALELAAARIKLLSVDQIADRLNDRFRLLTGGSRTALPRQQTLRAAIDWSHDLLPDGERALLRRLSVFVGGWTLEACEAVCSDEQIDVLDSLAHLVDKSLVNVDQSASAESRYRMLETIRQYAADKLLDSGESIGIRNQHLRFFDQFTIDAETGLYSNDIITWLDRTELEHDNLRAAFEWALEVDQLTALQIPIRLMEFWQKRGYISEGTHWLDEAFEQSEELPMAEDEAGRKVFSWRGRALAYWSRLTQIQGDNLPEALRRAEESLVFAERAQDEWLKAYAHMCIAFTSMFSNQFDRFVPAIEASQAIFNRLQDKRGLAAAYTVSGIFYGSVERNAAKSRARVLETIRLLTELGQPWDVVNAKSGLGYIAYFDGDLIEARRVFEECLRSFHEFGDKQFANSILSMLATIDKREGNLPRALTARKEVVASWKELGHRGAVARELENIAFIAIQQDQFKRAARLLGAADSLRTASHAIMRQMEQEEYARELAGLKLKMDEATFNAEWSMGQALTMNQAVEYALAES